MRNSVVALTCVLTLSALVGDGGVARAFDGPLFYAPGATPIGPFGLPRRRMMGVPPRPFPGGLPPRQMMGGPPRPMMGGPPRPMMGGMPPRQMMEGLPPRPMMGGDAAAANAGRRPTAPGVR